MAPATQNAEAIRTRLAEIVGQGNLLAGEAAAAYSAYGERPLAAVFPGDERELAEVACLANLERVQVAVWGAGTKQGVEPVQPREGIVLGTARLNATVELDVANLTVTTGAGKVVDDLRRELAGVRLFLPLDPADSARSTVGGTLAANSSGPNRLLYRTARDWALGLREVTPKGDVLRTGGKTVKDVAGYDLKKLWIGSWGTLGAITEATFRLLPLPEASATVAMAFPLLSSGCGAVAALLGSFLRPSSADLLSQGALGDEVEGTPGLKPGEYLLLVQVEGAVEAVDRQKRDLLEMAARNGARETTVLEGEAERQLWRQRKEVFADPAGGGDARSRVSTLIKGSVLLKRIFDYCAGLAALQDQPGLRVSLASHAGNGIVYALIAAEEGRAEEPVAAVEQAQRLASDCGGFAMVQRAPHEVMARVRVWPPRDDYGVMRGIKAQLDPNNLWSPARIPGGRA